MNKNIIKLLATAGLTTCILLTGCSETNEPERTGNAASEIETKPEESHFVFIEQMPDKPIKITKSKDGNTIYKSLTVEDFKITQKARVDRPIADKIQTVITNAINRHAETYMAENDEFVAAVNEGIITLETASIPYETKVFYDEVRNDGRAISVKETIESYSAGTLSNTSVFAYNFDPRTGKQITTDLFYAAGDQVALDTAEDIMLAKITEKYGDVVDYKLVNASLIDTAQDTWYFTQDGIVVNFFAGEIADESVGEISIHYTKDELPDFSQMYFN